MRGYAITIWLLFPNNQTIPDAQSGGEVVTTDDGQPRECNCTTAIVS